MSNNNHAQYAQTLLYKSLSSCKKIFWVIFFFSSAINILVMFMPIYTMQILDRVVTSGSVDTLILLTIITFLATFVMIILEGCRSMAMQKVGEWLEKTCSEELVLRALSLTVLNPGASGSQILRDMSSIRSFISGNVLIALFDLPWAILFFVLMFMINAKIAVIALIGIILVALLALLSEVTTGKQLKLINEAQVKNYSEIEAAIRNAEIVESMGMGPAIVRLWNRKNKVLSEMQEQTSFIGTIITSITKLLKIVLNTFILAGGIYFSLSTHQPVGGILACSMLMGRIMAPIDILIGSSKMITAARASYARLQSMLINIPVRNKAMELPVPLGHIQVEKIMFAPHGTQKPTIRGLSVEVMPGECVGVIGASGSGKSTFAKLLVGVWKPFAGSLKLDSGEIYTWNRDHFGQYVGYLPQDVELFHGTIKSNIARLGDEIEPHKVVLAARIAGVHELILSLPNGYDTVVGPGQYMLSGGQKQRIGLARAFYGDIKFLVLDEPNSNLDQVGEQCLMNALQYAKQKQITVIFTTHKLNMLSVTDKVLLMQDGMAAAYGPTAQVMAQMQQQQQAAQAQQQQPKPEAKEEAQSEVKSEKIENKIEPKESKYSEEEEKDNENESESEVIAEEKLIEEDEEKKSEINQAVGAELSAI